jgi:hypothetical protein
LGLKNLRAFNDALLGKWDWKIRSERVGLWYKALVNRYGESNETVSCVRRESSQWWVDINQLDLGVREIANEYSVKGTYKKIMETSSTPTNLSWLKIWNKSIPSKVSCLVCRLFQNKIATKDNLFRRGDISQGSLLCCSGCGTEESIFHLFFECPFFAGIWYHISSWMGISTALHKDGMDHLEQFEGLIGSGRAFTERVKVIWFACIWCI